MNKDEIDLDTEFLILDTEGLDNPDCSTNYTS